MTDFAAWPEAVQALAWRTPWRSLALHQITGSGLWQTSETPPETAPHDLMPKLALKSWQESGRLRMIPRDLPLADAIAARLASPTSQQRVVLHAWEDAETPPYLQLFPWTDMRQTTEARFQWSGKKLSLVSTCQRNSIAVAEGNFSQAGKFIADQIPELEHFVVQFAVPENGQPRILGSGCIDFPSAA